VQATPTTWRLIGGGHGLPETCRRWCGGEALPSDLARELAGSQGQTRAWNLYGPTETTIWSACAALPPGRTAEPDLGEAVAATVLRVLDADGHPAPAGLRGELMIGGEGLARGYLGRPGLTAERFLPDPFGPPGSRLYRTGDLAGRDADGRLLYRGRADDQVKIRGHRIEPGEVEARLLALPGVAQAAVTARPGPTGLRLLAYAVARAGAVLDGPALRAALAEALPDYMVPVQVTVLEHLPLTPNGKLDRRALPEPEAPATSRHIAPQTETERVLAGIWADLLGRERIGRDDDFFAVGGDSISAMQAVTAIRRAFDHDLTLRRFFELKTIAALADELTGLAPRRPRADDLAAMLETLDTLEFADD
ncbi:AMP-binding protein, partial [Methylobacterium aquaticum]